ncbi:MAG: LacI family DNA-binding transcriptional regulator [Sphaerochaetaceae bacterium]|nr:LacI family DNA-binding transcriptional regulator [Sphaerochaetaceae bacterium]
MKRNKITISCIAEEAGVGVGTVSRVLNNSPNVKPSTREKVLDIIKAKGYSPNINARGLARKESNRITIGILLPDLTNHFFMEIFEKMFHQFRGRGYDVLLFNYERHDPDTIQKVLNAQVSYLFVFAFSLEEVETEILSRCHVPLIYVGINIPGFFCVFSDSYQGGALAAEYLVNKGSVSPCYIAITPEGDQDTLRYSGFVDRMRELGVEKKIGMYHSRLNENDGYILGSKIVEEGVYDGIFCFCDDIAVGVSRAIRERGASVRVIGYDGISLTRHLQISTVSQNPALIGHVAAESMIRLIVKHELPEERQTVVYPTLIDFDT